MNNGKIIKLIVFSTITLLIFTCSKKEDKQNNVKNTEVSSSVLSDSQKNKVEEENKKNKVVLSTIICSFSWLNWEVKAISFSSKLILSAWNRAEKMSLPMKIPIARATMKINKNGSIFDIEFFCKVVKINKSLLVSFRKSKYYLNPLGAIV